MNILVIAEHQHQKLNPLTVNCIEAASKFRDICDVLLIGSKLNDVLNEVSSLPRVNKCLAIDAPELLHPIAELYAPIIANIAKDRDAKIKIVGHASIRTKDMPLAKHKLVNFNISDKRAQSVADIFIKKHNFPSNNLITEAVSDTKPLFKENMPAGTKANQRTEIFLIY